MKHQLSMRKTSMLGLTVLALLLSGFVMAASASAATQHWAGTSQPAAPAVPTGTQQEFSAERLTTFVLKWYLSGTLVTFECNYITASGKAENPVGGGAGIVPSGSMSLTGCEVASSPTKCEVENGVIPLPPLESTVVESGNDLIKTSYARNYFTIKSRAGQTCGVVGNHFLEGPAVLAQRSNGPGYYDFGASGSNLRFDGYSATLSGEIKLVTPSGKLLTESSTPTPGVAHWFIGSSNWTTFSAGQSVNYNTGASPSVTIKSVVAGAWAEFTCSAAGTGFSGSFVNPVGGGAGTTSAQLRLVNCAMVKPSPEKCAVPATITSNPLSGVAKEVSGVPTVEYSPSEGTELLTVAFQKAPGSSLCVVEGNSKVTGKIQASSVGDGNFGLAGSELKMGVNAATISGHMLLESEAGEALRLQP